MMGFNLNFIGDGFKGLTDTIGNVSGTIGNATGSFVKTVTDTVGKVSGTIGNATSGIIPTTITEEKTEKVKETVRAVRDDAAAAALEAQGYIGKLGGGLSDTIKNVTDTVGNISGEVPKFWKGVTDTVGNVSGSIGNWTGKYGKYIPIAAAAVGGLVLLSVLKK